MSQESEKERVTVRLLKSQRDDVMDFLAKYPEFGYTSFTDFVAEAVRLRISELKNQKMKEEERLKEGVPPSARKQEEPKGAPVEEDHLIEP